MARLFFFLALALTGLAWTILPCTARADETLVVYEDKAVVAQESPEAQEAPKVDASPAATSVETTLSTTSYSVGLQGGYGLEIGKPPNLDIVELHPSVAFPITNAVGSSFYRGVLEYKIEPFFGLIVNRNDRGEAGLSPIGFRYNFTGLGCRAVPFFEGLLGVVYLNVSKDIQSTRFNFTESAGAGMRVFVSDRVALDVSARFRHASNAGIRHPNHGFNTGYLLLGVDYY